jgi:hypothetical protein
MPRETIVFALLELPPKVSRRQCGIATIRNAFLLDRLASLMFVQCLRNIPHAAGCKLDRNREKNRGTTGTNHEPPQIDHGFDHGYRSQLSTNGLRAPACRTHPRIRPQVQHRAWYGHVPQYRARTCSKIWCACRNAFRSDIQFLTVFIYYDFVLKCVASCSKLITIVCSASVQSLDRDFRNARSIILRALSYWHDFDIAGTTERRKHQCRATQKS